MSNKLFTVGHSTHTVEKFINLLREHNITAICDVRSTPYSRYSPQFNREALKKELHTQGISYVFLGKEIGARSENPDYYNIPGKDKYAYLSGEPLFREGLRRVKKGMEKYQVALMCAEKDPLTCHRTILICRELRSHDIDISHILADGKLETNSATEKRLMDLLRIEPDMFRNEQQCIEEAYDRQAAKIAYDVYAEKPPTAVNTEKYG